MARRTMPQVIPWPAPYNGVIRSTALYDQPARSAINALNTRNRDPKDWRLRMCRRAGLSKWIADPVEDEDREVQDIAFLNLNVNPAGVDLTIPGEPGTDDPLGDPPGGFPPGDPVPDPEIPESEPDDPGDSEGEGPEQSFPDVSISDVSSSDDRCPVACDGIEAEIRLVIAPLTSRQTFCLPCAGSNEYGAVYQGDHVVTYDNGAGGTETSSFRFRLYAAIADQSTTTYQWVLDLFLLEDGEPAGSYSMRLIGFEFTPSISVFTPLCIQMTDDSQPNMRKFLSKLGDSLLRDATTVTGSDIDHNCDGIDLGDCEETCTDEVGVWLLIDPDTEVRPYCLPCIGSNDYGNVYAASHMVTYMDGEMEITSLIYMKLELVGVIDSGEEYVKWRLGLFLTNMGEPASDPEVRLETNIFNADVTGITGPPYCPDEAPDSTPAVNEFLDIVRDEGSPLAQSTNEWSLSADVRFDPQCYAGPRVCDSVECDDHPTLSFTIDVVLLDPPGCVGGQTMQFSATLTQDPEKSCRWVYDVPDEPTVTLECFEDGDFSGFWLLSVIDTGGNAIIARRVIDDGPLGDYLFPPTAGGGIGLAECTWSFIVLEVGA